MIEFRRNKETGILEAYKDGEKVGSVKTMGDEVKNNEVKKDAGIQSGNKRRQHR